MRPVPQPTALSQPFWDACARGELVFLECRACATRFFPPLPACVHCLSEDVHWRRSAGRGSVYSFTVMHREPSPGFAVPSVLAIVEIDEGYAMFGNIVGYDPAEVSIGLPVEVFFEELANGLRLPNFRPRAT
jgi:uncharacterized OB-fold protein